VRWIVSQRKKNKLRFPAFSGGVLLDRPDCFGVTFRGHVDYDMLVAKTAVQASKQQHHRHMKTCQKGVAGLTGCRLCLPFVVSAATTPWVLVRLGEEELETIDNDGCVFCTVDGGNSTISSVCTSTVPKCNSAARGCVPPVNVDDSTVVPGFDSRTLASVCADGVDTFSINSGACFSGMDEVLDDDGGTGLVGVDASPSKAAGHSDLIDTVVSPGIFVMGCNQIPMNLLQRMMGVKTNPLPMIVLHLMGRKRHFGF
jgi:hypothetical protein